MAILLERSARQRKLKRVFGPGSAGISMSLREFDQSEFLEGYQYELIKGVLIVSPAAVENERDPNEELGFLLRLFKLSHPNGHLVDKTLFEQTIKTRANRRRADRAIWIGHGRLPRKGQTPDVVAEFVSRGRRDRNRDYVDKRDEYMEINVGEYWIFDRFRHTLTVYKRQGSKIIKKVYGATDTYRTPLLPGFEIPLAQIFALADEWPSSEEEEYP